MTRRISIFILILFVLLQISVINAYADADNKPDKNNIYDYIYYVEPDEPEEPIQTFSIMSFSTMSLYEPNNIGGYLQSPSSQIFNAAFEDLLSENYIFDYFNESIYDYVVVPLRTVIHELDALYTVTFAVYEYPIRRLRLRQGVNDGSVMRHGINLGETPTVTVVYHLSVDYSLINGDYVGVSHTNGLGNPATPFLDTRTNVHLLSFHNGTTTIATAYGHVVRYNSVNFLSVGTTSSSDSAYFTQFMATFTPRVLYIKGSIINSLSVPHGSDLIDFKPDYSHLRYTPPDNPPPDDGGSLWDYFVREFKVDWNYVQSHFEDRLTTTVSKIPLIGQVATIWTYIYDGDFGGGIFLDVSTKAKIESLSATRLNHYNEVFRTPESLSINVPLPFKSSNLVCGPLYYDPDYDKPDFVYPNTDCYYTNTAKFTVPLYLYAEEFVHLNFLGVPIRSVRDGVFFFMNIFMWWNFLKFFTKFAFNLFTTDPLGGFLPSATGKTDSPESSNPVTLGSGGKSDKLLDTQMTEYKLLGKGGDKK